MTGVGKGVLSWSTAASFALLMVGDACAPSARSQLVADADDAGAPDASEGPPRVSFRRDIRPYMDHSSTDEDGHGCAACHYSTRGSHIGLDATGLDLATLGALRRGGENTGTDIILTTNPGESGLARKLRGTFHTGERMPKDGPPYWSDDDIEAVEQWIKEGAVGTDDE